MFYLISRLKKKFEYTPWLIVMLVLFIGILSTKRIDWYFSLKLYKERDNKNKNKKTLTGSFLLFKLELFLNLFYDS